MNGTHRSVLASPAGDDRTRDDVPLVEDLRLRNYDHETAHLVDVTVRTDRGPVCRERYRLPPDETICVVDALRAGENRIEVTVDGDRRETTTLSVVDSTTHTATVEIGNGAVSVTAETTPAVQSR